jgi:hypothetical protein
LPPLPPLPPLPDFSTLPPLPGESVPVEPSVPGAMPNFGLPEQPVSTPSVTPTVAPPSNDPGQFKLPGQ